MTQDSTPKLQENNNTTKTKKDMGKWCEFHKSPTHNTSDFWAKKSLVVELKASELDAFYDSESKRNKGNEKGKQIIDANPTAIISTTKIQNIERKGSVSSTRRCG